MESLRSSLRLLASIGCAAVLIGASLPQAMVGPGEWEITKSASATHGDRICLRDPALLMQWEHRSKKCTRAIVTSSLDRAELNYTCAGGGFGTSRVEMLTPRSVKINTQGISDGLPFAYVLHARRVGDCAAR